MGQETRSFNRRPRSLSLDGWKWIFIIWLSFAWKRLFKVFVTCCAEATKSQIIGLLCDCDKISWIYIPNQSSNNPEIAPCLACPRSINFRAVKVNLKEIHWPPGPQVPIPQIRVFAFQAAHNTTTGQEFKQCRGHFIVSQLKIGQQATAKGVAEPEVRIKTKHSHWVVGFWGVRGEKKYLHWIGDWDWLVISSESFFFLLGGRGREMDLVLWPAALRCCNLMIIICNSNWRTSTGDVIGGKEWKRYSKRRRRLKSVVIIGSILRHSQILVMTRLAVIWGKIYNQIIDLWNLISSSIMKKAPPTSVRGEVTILHPVKCRGTITLSSDRNSTKFHLDFGISVVINCSANSLKYLHFDQSDG